MGFTREVMKTRKIASHKYRDGRLLVVVTGQPKAVCIGTAHLKCTLKGLFICNRHCAIKILNPQVHISSICHYGFGTFAFSV